MNASLILSIKTLLKFQSLNMWQGCIGSFVMDKCKYGIFLALNTLQMLLKTCIFLGCFPQKILFSCSPTSTKFYCISSYLIVLPHWWWNVTLDEAFCHSSFDLIQ